MLLHEDGHLRVSDFGLSVELKEKNGFKIRGNAGTAGYLGATWHRSIHASNGKEWPSMAAKGKENRSAGGHGGMALLA